MYVCVVGVSVEMAYLSSVYSQHTHSTSTKTNKTCVCTRASCADHDTLD